MRAEVKAEPAPTPPEDAAGRRRPERRAAEEPERAAKRPRPEEDVSPEQVRLILEAIEDPSKRAAGQQVTTLTPNGGGYGSAVQRKRGYLQCIVNGTYPFFPWTAETSPYTAH